MDSLGCNTRCLKLELHERELDSLQSRDHEVELCQTLRLQVEDLQKRLEEKDNKLTEANKVIRALRDEVQTLQQQLEQHRWNYQHQQCQCGRGNDITTLPFSDVAPHNYPPCLPPLRNELGIPASIFLSCTSEDDPANVPLSPGDGTLGTLTSPRQLKLPVLSVKLQDCRAMLGPGGVFKMRTKDYPSDEGDDDGYAGPDDDGGDSDYNPEYEGLNNCSTNKETSTPAESITEPEGKQKRQSRGGNRVEAKTTRQYADRYECTECGETFSFPSWLAGHLRRKHGQKKSTTVAPCEDTSTDSTHKKTSTNSPRENTPEKSMLSAPEKSMLSAPEKSMLSAPEKSMLSAPEKSMLSAPEESMLSAPEESIAKPEGEQKRQSRGGKRVKAKTKDDDYLSYDDEDDDDEDDEYNDDEDADYNPKDEGFNVCSTMNKISAAEESIGEPEGEQKRQSRGGKRVEAKTTRQYAERYECMDCGETFSFPFHFQLSLHQCLHASKKPATDSPRGKTSTGSPNTTSSRHLSDHDYGITIAAPDGEQKRSEAKPTLTKSQSSDCGKTFPTPSKLACHQRSHARSSISRKRKSTNGPPENQMWDDPCDCDVCGKTLACWKNLVNHKRIHTGEKPYACTQCGRTFRSLKNLRVHEKLVHGLQKTQSTKKSQNTGSCQEVDQTSTQSSNLNQHSIDYPHENASTASPRDNTSTESPSHQEANKASDPQILRGYYDPHDCDVCGKTLKTRGYLRSHMKVHTGERPYVCGECGKTFKYLSEFHEHKYVHTGERPYACDQCGKAFAKASVLRVHKIYHTAERPHACTQCEKTFHFLQDLKNHQSIHTQERPYKCSLCPKAFRRRKSLARHVTCHSGEKPYACKVCSKTFRTSSQRKKHEISHSGEKPYMCEVCGTTFTQLANLRGHKSVHTGERPFSCSQCDKTFRSKSNLRKHAIRHTGERPFKCTDCGKSFGYRSSLFTHRRMHTGAQFVCSACGRAFAARSSLQRHHRVHSREKPYQCAVCGEKFAYTHAVLRHQRKVHGDKTLLSHHKCERCGQGFGSAQALKSHDCSDGADGSPSSPVVEAGDE